MISSRISTPQNAAKNLPGGRGFFTHEFTCQSPPDVSPVSSKTHRRATDVGAAEADGNAGAAAPRCGVAVQHTLGAILWYTKR
jgi:hypothetical protein